MKKFIRIGVDLGKNYFPVHERRRTAENAETESPSDA
jgi:hypothetical protein